MDLLSPYLPGIHLIVQHNKSETLTWGPLYLKWEDELVVFKEMLYITIAKGFISQYISPFAVRGLLQKLQLTGIWLLSEFMDIKSKVLIKL